MMVVLRGSAWTKEAKHGIARLEAKPGNWLRKEFLTIIGKHMFQIGGNSIKA